MKINNLFEDIIEVKEPLNRDILAKYLYQYLKDIELYDFLFLITNKFNEILEYIELSNGGRACQKTSLLFNPHRLDTRTKESKFSLFEALKNESFVSGLSRALIFKKGKVNELLYQALQLGINGIQYVNEFPPHIARNIYKEFGLEANSKILDPCAGWGGRMIGASIISNNYTCYEPSTKTVSGLLRLYDFIKSMNNDFVANIHNIPFEDSCLEEDWYDFALTSPPYYDTEIYSDEEINSLNAYKTFDQWCNYFYLPLINKTMKALKTDGKFMLNIGSRKYPLNKVLMDNFSTIYGIKKCGNYLSGSGGLGKEGEGEMFYLIIK